MALAVSDFKGFFEDVHGKPPFKWQTELVQRVCDKGWPKTLDMPTSSGKTAVIDMAVFHLALESDKKGRKAPLRIAFVVDRRLVVDDAFDHARKITDKLQGSDNPITCKISKALGAISPNGKPLEVVKLRGGMPRENDWSKTPSQPLVIVSTVDQIGSRLLFRGYGVSHTMRPIHAGLLGTDTLIILDEAHTSQPFLDTLEQIRDMRHGRMRHPFQVMFMSATPPPGQTDLFPPKERRKELLSDDKICQRIDAHKYAKLVPVKSDDSTPVQFVENGFSFKSKDVRTVGIVVNRVLLARQIFETVKSRIKESKGDEAHLLIGRCRPFERDVFVKQELDKIRENGGTPDGKRVFFVSTQCIEVGVDVSFDALVTQIAPVDSLCQRFGRLNRTGVNEVSSAIVVAPANDISSKADDPVYKKASANTWDYLKKIADDDKIDFGIKYFKRPKNDELAELVAPKLESAHIFPAYVQFWMQTKPPPHPDPDPALFLHGIGSKSADVQIIWRADLENRKDSDLRTLRSHPSPLEAISVPIWTARKWLAGKNDPTINDVEGAGEPRDEEEEGGKYVLLWCGTKSKDTRMVESDMIRPGHTIIVPASYGGCDKYGWDSNKREPVKDIGMETNLVHYRLLSMRFVKSIIDEYAEPHVWNAVKEVTHEHADDDDIGEFFDTMIDVDGFPEPWKEMMNVLKKKGAYPSRKMFDVDIRVEGGRPRITGFTYRKKLKKSQIQKIFASWKNYDTVFKDRDLDDAAEATTEEEHSEGTRVMLNEHCNGVKDMVTKFGKHAGLEQPVLGDMQLAARLHDSGKAERRTQAFLQRRDVDELPDHIPDDKLLAKSLYGTKSVAEYEKYLRMAQLPKGDRHECWSVSLAKSHPDLKDANDPELVLYLIGTHHGYGRPLFPPIADSTNARTFSFDGATATSDYNVARLDSGWVDMLERIHQRYDPWDLAYMEAVIRLADHRQSEQERNR